MKKTKSRILASFVAVMLCFTAFSTVAFANGNDPEAKPETTASTEQAEETETPTTGGIEDTADADENASDTTETEIFYIRHITSPYYILLFIGCAGNDVICDLGSFYNSFSERNYIRDGGRHRGTESQ